MARKFRFRLETVRRLREQARDAQRRVVADAVRAVTRVEDRIARLTQQLHDTVDRFRDAQRAERLDVASLRGHQIYRSWLHRNIVESNEELARQQAKLDYERAKLAEAWKRVKAIEKLRERQWKCHLTEVAREERAANDEAALQMYMRRRIEHLREAVA